MRATPRNMDVQPGVSSVPKPPSLADPLGYSLRISPLQERNHVLPADAEAVSDRPWRDYTLASELAQGRGEPLERCPCVVALAAHGLHAPAACCETQDGCDIPAPGLVLELGQAGRTELRLLQYPDDPVDFGVTTLDSGGKARQHGQP